MILSLIGMSNTGKTHWSKLLEQEMRYKRYTCDDLIEKKLEADLQRLGFSGTSGLSSWMGQPFEERYGQNSKKYLEYEEKAIKEIIEDVSAGNHPNVVIDTTGSIIYLGDHFLGQLKALGKIVYLDTPLAVRKQFYQNYIKNPKPVIWGDSFTQKPGESGSDALKRCYPRLLEYRTQKYRDHSDLILDYSQLRQKAFNIRDFIRKIEDSSLA